MAVPGMALAISTTGLVVALTLAMIQRSSNWFEDVNLPFGFNVPLLIAFAGAGYFIYATRGVRGIINELSSIIFFSVVTLLLVQRFLRGENKKL